MTSEKGEQAERSFDAPRVQLVEVLHARRDKGEGSKAHGVQAAVVTVVDKNLSGPATSSVSLHHSGVADPAADVRLDDGIVFDLGVLPVE